MRKKVNIEEFIQKPGHLSGFLNSTAMAAGMGMNLKKIFVLPDGAKISYINVNEKNIKILLAKYESYLKPDEGIIKADINYNARRYGMVYSDDEATMVIGHVDTQGVDCPYKIYQSKDKKVFATFFFERQEEVIVNKFKKMVRMYDDCHRLIRLIEKNDEKTTVFKIDPVTNDITCYVYDTDTNVDVD